MRLLVLGGTRFVGPAFVDDALRRGWDVTLAHRGRTGTAPDGVHQVLLDRTEPGAVHQLSDEHYDVVADTWSGAPSVARDTARALSASTDRWVYVSSRSVYAWPMPRGLDESGATHPDADPDAGATHYAADKRGTELALERELGAERVVHLRAGLVLGPRENVGRLPWWLRRMARGGRVLAPAPADLPIQYVDARDLAAFGLDCARDGRQGPVNTVSPPSHATFGALLAAALDVTSSSADLEWVDPTWLVEQGVQPWTELPIWMPESDEGYALHDGDVSRAREWGLRIRPLHDTVADTWSWLQQDERSPLAPSDHAPSGLAPERESELLELWDARGDSGQPGSA